jgi:pyruvate/2-oxoglutarate dehydrogenase complex dihydrolipoamide acyltransferase (E2) component
MTDTKTFHLPDLGEGLPDATIVEWFIKEGDVIRLDEPLVSMETAKAVVEVPSPVSGKVLKLAGNAGDIVVTGAMLAEFEPDPNLPQRADGQDTGHAHGPAKSADAKAPVGAASSPGISPAEQAKARAEDGAPTTPERDDADRTGHARLEPDRRPGRDVEPEAVRDRTVEGESGVHVGEVDVGADLDGSVGDVGEGQLTVLLGRPVAVQLELAGGDANRSRPAAGCSAHRSSPLTGSARAG